MSQLLFKALKLSGESLSQSAINSAKNATVTIAELDGGFIMIDHYGEKGVRKTMEDECIICDSLRKLNPQLPQEYDFVVCGLFDGHGGKQTAVFAKQNLLSEICSQIVTLSVAKDESEEFSPEIIFKKAVNAACRRLDTRIANEITGCSDGSTALLLFFGKKTVYIVNLGDSAAYLCRKLESVIHSIPLNDIHKPWSQREKGRILHYGGTIEGGRVNGVLEITRSFGDLQLKKYGVLCVGTFRKVDLDFNKDEFIMLGCDGFWGVFDANDACRKTLDFINKEESRASTDPDAPVPSIKRVCKELVDLTLNVKRSQDNVSVLIIRLKAK
ncbi:protein phosphatase 2C, putative [Theileria equi strain WA]|uniref:protein-serine/threonine phosphatase n=1 Tax=Theileria equi strain WA TaxID=1537102 RepID=L0AYA9_THEEQ|nr:protein phosphatase 2C, putative [Theileria equi strain WA]AFZ80572.1 protein phosphatase 2C, putative [Theileria equi strain WA]|eukprot:XP_004830238.1 protein phosphatase 2C, putative [Theileria equi strain WA]